MEVTLVASFSSTRTLMGTFAFQFVWISIKPWTPLIRAMSRLLNMWLFHAIWFSWKMWFFKVVFVLFVSVLMSNVGCEKNDSNIHGLCRLCVEAKVYYMLIIVNCEVSSKNPAQIFKISSKLYLLHGILIISKRILEFIILVGIGTDFGIIFYRENIENCSV